MRVKIVHKRGRYYVKVQEYWPLWRWTWEAYRESEDGGFETLEKAETFAMCYVNNIKKQKLPSNGVVKELDL